jgi:hypothetical protein
MTMNTEYWRTITNLFIYGDGFLNIAYGTNGNTMQFNGVMVSKNEP